MTLGKDMCTAKETPEPEKARIQFQVRFLTHSKLVNVIYLHLHIFKRSMYIIYMYIQSYIWPQHVCLSILSTVILFQFV